MLTPLAEVSLCPAIDFSNSAGCGASCFIMNWKSLPLTPIAPIILTYIFIYFQKDGGQMNLQPETERVL